MDILFIGDPKAVFMLHLMSNLYGCRAQQVLAKVRTFYVQTGQWVFRAAEKCAESKSIALVER